MVKQPHAGGSDKSAAFHRFVTFYVNNLFFGLDVLQVQELLRFQEITPIPRAPETIHGLINLRGQIVTAIHLRHRLKLAPALSHQPPMNIVSGPPTGR